MNYCVLDIEGRPSLDCNECSLVNYGLDCHNQPVKRFEQQSDEEGDDPEEHIEEMCRDNPRM